MLEKQKELGFEVFTDGELRRSNFMSDFTDAVEGFDLDDAVARKWADTAQNTGTQSTTVSRVNGIVTSRLKQREPITGHELPFLQEHVAGPIKMTLPSPTQFPAISFKYGLTDGAYRDPYELLDAITGIMADDMRTLSASGISYLQIDAPRYSYYLDPKWTSWMEKELRVDPAQMLTASLDADNACFAAARNTGVTLAIHLCRGNNRSNWYASGGYDAIAEKVFNQLDVDRFLLEYDDERSGTFEPLRFVPKDKIVVLGLVSTKVGTLESADQLAKLIDQATKYIPLDRLALSPQCGFASMSEGNIIPEDAQWAKMKLVADVAKKVWG